MVRFKDLAIVLLGNLLVFVCIIYAILHFLIFPTFVTKHGISVWAYNIDEVTKEMIEEASEFYIAELPKKFKFLDSERILRELDNVEIYWYCNSLKCGKNSEKWCRGTYLNKRIRLVWYPATKNMSETAFFHELHHLVDDRILLRDGGEHLDTIWWESVHLLNSEFRFDKKE
jgi:hypothetical protein